jgi:opacity protein-like surface antigen
MTRATVGLAAAAGLALALGASAASAQGMGTGSWYVKGFGGFTLPQDDDFKLNARDGSGSIDSGLNFDTGYTLGIAGGYEITPNIAVELEYAYRNAEADPKGVNSGKKKTESNAWMVNAIYNFTPMGATGAWQPYAGAGLGAADLNLEQIGSLGGGDFDSDYNFAYQVIGGVAYNWTANWSMNMEARFFGINDQDLENSDYSFKTTYQTVDVLFGATYHF